MELISVIVPVYNAEKYLFRCVDSILNQTYTNLEIILVDDGSPDNCSKMCDDFSERDVRVKVIHKSNAGQGLARNDGLDIATGAYVTFVDSDDWISPEHVENLYNALKNNGADASLGNHTRVSADEVMTPRLLPLREGVYEGERIVCELILPLIGADTYGTRDVLINSSVSMNMYRMECIKQNNIRFISERYAVAEDFYFNLDFFHYASKVVYIICDRIKRYGLSEKVDYRAERSFLMKIRVAIRHIVLSDLSHKEKLSQIKEILGHDTVKNVLSIYPIETYAWSMRLLMNNMRRENAVMVYYLMRLREIGRGYRGTKAFLRLIGIGR